MNRKNKDLRVVRDSEDVDKLVRRIMDNTEDEETQMAMAGIRSAIKPDEVIDSMRRIGNDMPACLKETSEGGLAITPSALKIKAKLEER